jgi:hypothetical protein
MTGKQVKKLTYRDYRAYPPELLNAARFRDSYITLPPMRFINLADRTKMLSQLVTLSQWESDHTDV